MSSQTAPEERTHAGICISTSNFLTRPQATLHRRMLTFTIGTTSKHSQRYYEHNKIPKFFHSQVQSYLLVNLTSIPNLSGNALRGS